MYRRFFKRFLDVVLSLMGLIVLAVPMLIVALVIKLDSPGPVIFRQERLGRNGTVYWMYKFRSMKVGAEHTGSGVYSGKGDERVTKVGRFLRASSIDELPQLLNVLRGDMSLIGFRSPLTYHPWPWEEYTDEQRKMFTVRPGITGWAQVNGLRGDTSIEERVKYDIWYIENWSIWLDVKILLMTAFGGMVNPEKIK